MRENERILRDFMERVWNQGDLEAVDELVAESYTIHSDPGDPWEGQTLDREGFKHRLVTSNAPFPDLKFDIEEVLVDGDKVTVGWTIRATHQAPLNGMPATGRPISIKGLTVYDLVGGRIAGHRQVVDRLAVLQQLGMLG